MIAFATRYQSTSSMTSQDFHKSVWWFQVEFLEWTLKVQKQMVLYQWLTCWITNDRSKQPGHTLMKKEDLSSGLYTTFQEMKKCLILTERNVILDFSWTMALLFEIMMQTKFLSRFTTMQQINLHSLRRKWSKIIQSTKSLELARI